MIKKLIFAFLVSGILMNCKPKEIKTFLKCEFKLQKIENISLAGVDIENVKSIKDLNFLEAAKITSASMSESLPMNFDLIILAKNPNKEKAAVNKLEWVAMVDNVKLLEGIIDKPIEIEAGADSIPIVLKVNSDLKEVFNKESAGSLIGLALNIVNKSSNETKITIKIKPFITIGKKNIAYPGYINLSKEFRSQ